MIGANLRGIMKRHIFTALALAFAAVSGATAGSIVYDNTTTDKLEDVLYSIGPYTQIGDQVTLGGLDRALTDASVQFFNEGGSGGTFDAVLRFWNPGTDAGTPVGAQIGGDYEVDGLAIDTFSPLTASFSIPNLTVPDTVVATVEILSASAGIDLGLELYDSPTIGSSNNDSYIVNDGTSFQTARTLTNSDNIYLQLSATTSGPAAPEPSTGVMAGGLVFMAIIAKRSIRSKRSRRCDRALPPVT